MKRSDIDEIVENVVSYSSGDVTIRKDDMHFILDNLIDKDWGWNGEEEYPYTLGYKLKPLVATLQYILKNSK